MCPAAGACPAECVQTWPPFASFSFPQHCLLRLSFNLLAPRVCPWALPPLQVFVGGNHVGGCDDTVAAFNSGKLKTLLEAAGVKAKL